MAVYIFSLLKGYKPNGVDYAQGYRARILRNLSCPAKYVYGFSGQEGYRFLQKNRNPYGADDGNAFVFHRESFL